MKPDTLSLLASPGGREPLQWVSACAADADSPEALVSAVSGTRFPLRDGIPVFVQDSDVTGANRKYRDLYDAFSPFYDLSQRLFYAFRGGEAEARGGYLREIEIKPGDRVLEVSVGTGANLRLLPPVATYYGLDLSWGQLRQCRQVLRRTGREAELFLGEAENLPFQDEVFDVVFHFGGINYFNDKRRAITEMIRVAKPGTKIVIADETEKIAKRYERVSAFYQDRTEVISAPVDLVPPEMLDVKAREIRCGELYCLTFRKPPKGAGTAV